MAEKEFNMVIDLGNTRIKYGLFRGTQLINHYHSTGFQTEGLMQLAYNQKVKNIIISSTSADVTQLKSQLSTDFNTILLDTETPLPINIDYDTPETLGKDRIAAVIGAYQLYPGENCVIIDAGTCITYDLLVDGVYLGGNIAPGLQMRLQAMHDFTARLPKVEPDNSENLAGKSTEMALRNGAQWGIRFEMEGYINYWQAKYGPLTVIATGGDASFFEKMMKREIFVNSNLVLIGLNQILNYNA